MEFLSKIPRKTFSAPKGYFPNSTIDNRLRKEKAATRRNQIETVIILPEILFLSAPGRRM